MTEDKAVRQLSDKIVNVGNILVTVSHDPTVDQLTAALATTLALNKMGKRSIAVFSGEIPQVIHFLDPEKTFESNADSLRDFIISISKDKADRLRVRPEGNFVKVYITPYRTKITSNDLQFSDGDFNVELIIAYGVSSRDDLDASIASHGKIFHDAITATINLGQTEDKLGNISIQDVQSGCYSVSGYNLIRSLSSDKKQLIDSAVATALLTGVVSATDQFRNSTTTPDIMNVAADLMRRGANQQLIVSQLDPEGDHEAPVATEDQNTANDDMTFNRDRNPDDDSPQKKEAPAGPRRYSLDEAPAHADDAKYDGNRIEQRLWSDNKAVKHEQSQDALRRAKEMLDNQGSNSNGGNSPYAGVKASPMSSLKQPEVVRAPLPKVSVTPLNAQSRTAAPARQDNTAKLAPVVSDNYPDIRNDSAGIEQNTAPKISVPASSYSAPQIESDGERLTGAPIQPANTRGGTAIPAPTISRAAGVQPLTNNQNADDRAPFNAGNQISPIPPLDSQRGGNVAPAAARPVQRSEFNRSNEEIAPLPMPSEPVSNGAANASMMAAANRDMSLPPIPPAPVNGDNVAGMPPAASGNTGANAVQPAPQPGTEPASTDPSQFVIPS